ncbi:alpha/beta hydrolase [Flavilitoribacter nigricans]|uniref:Esterase n=1 Tax=Flavilitoribacter nigricans (strain ATCC 23147 / DSM 23189 / NBRC 102662 / NCIMB 1420 / SS-2) TaxID=1122177 RepID=A0A2D0N1Q2_FLAN2|nr:alpha/beta hydrolase [Flavilitoribacter nigricans]PHN01643.1 esterase [Flavilitoribacter nigricans DSM 23189 = NBRC 102662]
MEKYHIHLRTVLAFVGLIGLLPAVSSAQSATYPVDSTYTVKGSYEKMVQYRPDIVTALGVVDEYINTTPDVVYKSIGERKLHLDIYGPRTPGKKPAPIIFMIHGGGWSSGTKSHMDAMARDLAFNGYLAVAVEYRLSPEIQYPAGIEDLQDAVQWIAENGARYGGDGKKIVVLGASAGAHLASFLGTTENDLLPYKQQKSRYIKGIVNIDGIVSFIHPEASQEGKSAGRWLGGGRDTHWHNWTEASPLEYVDKKSPPILFVNGAYPRFHAGRDSLVARYQDYGTYYHIFEFSDAPHTFWFFYPWYNPMMYKILDFLDHIL